MLFNFLMEPVNNVLGKLQEHAEKKNLVSSRVGDRLHITVNPERIKELSEALKVLTSAEHGFRQKVTEDAIVLRRPRFQKGLKRALNWAPWITEFEIKLVKSDTHRTLSSGDLMGRLKQPAYLSFSASDKHEITLGQFKQFTGILNEYALKRQKE